MTNYSCLLLLGSVLAVVSGCGGQVGAQEARPVQQLLEVGRVDVAGSAQDMADCFLQQGVHRQAAGPLVQVPALTEKSQFQT